MPSCEMCGYGTVQLHKSIVEGTILLLCDKCVRYGEVIALKKPSEDLVVRRLSVSRTSRHASAAVSGYQILEEETLSRDYSVKVKRAREKMGKTQEEIALALAEKLSVIQSVESGRMEPQLKLAKKLEQFFKIELVKKEGSVTEGVSDAPLGGGSYTIGDMLHSKED